MNENKKLKNILLSTNFAKISLFLIFNLFKVKLKSHIIFQYKKILYSDIQSDDLYIIDPSSDGYIV